MPNEWDDFNEEGSIERLKRKTKESPFMVVGLTGCAIAAGVGLYRFKDRKIRPSIYLMRLRLIAQGTVVGCLTAGIIYSLASEHIFHVKPKEN